MNIVIIGNGISGTTAARWIRKFSDHHITIVSSETKYFYSRTALMYIYMGHMRQKDTQPYESSFWEKNRIDLLQKHVDKIDFTARKMTFSDGENLTYDKLILAVGSKTNRFGWPGQDLKGVEGLYTLQDLEIMEKHSKGLKRAVIVGGGLIGIEMAEMFRSRNIPVTMLVREESYWNNVLPNEESHMINNHIREHHVDLMLSTELNEIIGDENGSVKCVITNGGDHIDCGFVGLTAGVSPNISFLKDSPLELGRGIMVDENLRTNIDGVYAIGDCAQIKSPLEHRRGVEAIWYTGRMMGETVAYNICNQPKSYNPGIWFNSAKFFDIEYQVYGNVQAKLPEEHTSLIWAHPELHKSIRIVFDKGSKTILGFNLMGIRFRHEVCEKWIKSMTPVEEVLSNIKLAFFDPEFYDEYSSPLIAEYNEKFGGKLSVRKKRSLNAVLNFLKT